MDARIITKLFHEGLINEQEFNNLTLQKDTPVSVHWDLRTLLYLGIVLFTTAIGILIYKNIETIGHSAMLVIIGALSATCFGYCIKKSNGYNNAKVESPDIWFDYVLLLGCLLLLTFTGYVQYAYNVFGNQWGLALFIPMIILFIAAYYFDHLGVLSLAITNFAAWAGISVTPLRILKENDFDDRHISYVGLLIGVSLVAMAFFVRYKKIKAHFAFTYKNFGAHIMFISLLSLISDYGNFYLIWFIIFAGVAFLFFKDAIRENSFYFMVITLLYAYIGLSHGIVQLLLLGGFETILIYGGIIYFILSGIGLIRLFIHYNKIFKKNAGI